MRERFLLVIGMAVMHAGCSSAASRPTESCSTVVPAQIRGPQPRWLGDCTAGKAAGVGVLRVGSGTSFGFFFGRVAAGKPQTGLIMLRDGNMMEIQGVTTSGAVIPTDGLDMRQGNRAWADAAAGARLVARRFAASGNAGSSAYYARWARKIETQRPE